MSKTLLNFWLDVTLLLAFLTILWSSAVLRFVFPPGTAADGWQLWGWSYDRWFEFQFWSLVFFAFAVLLHVMLHWTWICGVVSSKIWRRRDSKGPISDGVRTLYGVGLLAALLHLLGAAYFFAQLAVVPPG